MAFQDPRCCNCNQHHPAGACTSDRRVPRYENQPGAVTHELSLRGAVFTEADVVLAPSGFGLAVTDRPTPERVLVAAAAMADSIRADELGSKAKKMDVGKAPLVQGCLRYFARALLAVAYVSEYGDRKYSQPDKASYSMDWQNVPNGLFRYSDAEARHLVKPIMEGDYDAESELAHLAHKAWNALAALEIALKNGVVDCRVGVVVINGVPQPGTSKKVEL